MPATIEEQASPRFSESEFTYEVVRAAYSRQRPTPVLTRKDDATPKAIPPERLGIASANIRYLSAIIKQLVELRNEAETDEYGTLRASEYAFETASHLLTDAAIVSAPKGRQIPNGCASTDSEGGIRIEWVRPTSSVHVVIPASAERTGYIYHEVGDRYDTTTATPEALSHWLREIS